MSDPIEQLAQQARGLVARPVPARLEVGWLTHVRLRLLVPNRDELAAPPLADLTGIPIVERTDMAADMWRLLDSDGNEIASSGPGQIDAQDGGD